MGACYVLRQGLVDNGRLMYIALVSLASKGILKIDDWATNRIKNQILTAIRGEKFFLTGLGLDKKGNFFILLKIWLLLWQEFAEMVMNSQHLLRKNLVTILHWTARQYSGYWNLDFSRWLQSFWFLANLAWIFCLDRFGYASVKSQPLYDIIQDEKLFDLWWQIYDRTWGA